MTTSSELNRLRSLAGAGYASPEELARLAELDGTSAGPPRPAARGRVAPPARARSTPVAPPDTPVADDDDIIFVNLNTESFEQGGNNFFPPASGEAIYPGRCTGILVPNQVTGQVWFLLEGTEEPFQGALVTANLDHPNIGPGGSGAWKMKQVLDTLEVPYEVLEGVGVQFSKSALNNIPCQVEWSYIDNKGKRELRIQNIYPAGQRIEGL